MRSLTSIVHVDFFWPYSYVFAFIRFKISYWWNIIMKVEKMLLFKLKIVIKRYLLYLLLNNKFVVCLFFCWCCWNANRIGGLCVAAAVGQTQRRRTSTASLPPTPRSSMGPTSRLPPQLSGNYNIIATFIDFSFFFL